MVDVLVKIPEGQQAGPVSQAEHLVHILLGLMVDASLEHKVEELAEAQKAHRAEEVVHSEWVVAQGLLRAAPLETEGSLLEPCKLLLDAQLMGSCWKLRGLQALGEQFACPHPWP